jgi:hypothetical protein
MTRRDGRLDACSTVLAAHPAVSSPPQNDGRPVDHCFPGSMRRASPSVRRSRFFAASAGVPVSVRTRCSSSARGGELAKPEGARRPTRPSRAGASARSSNGTGMASPHVAGLAAILLSAAQTEHRSVFAEDLRRALSASATAAGARHTGDGAGFRISGKRGGFCRVRPLRRRLTSSLPTVQAARVISLGRTDTLVRFRIRRTRGSGPLSWRCERRARSRARRHSHWMVPKP